MLKLQVNARTSLGGRLLAAAALCGMILAGLLAEAPSARAQVAQLSLLDQYFPEGVPGYGAEPGTTVLSRARPEYDPLGIRLGDFIIRPEVDESLGYNSNILGQVPAQGTVTEETDGTVRFNSDWARNSLGGQINVDNQRSLSIPNEDQTNWSASLGGTYQIGNDVLTLAGSHLNLFEDPTSIDAISFNRPGLFYTAPIPYTVNDLRASYAANFGRITLTPDFDFTQLRFGDVKLFALDGNVLPPVVNGFVDGVPLTQNYFDRDLYEGGVTARYEFSPLRNALLVVRDTSIDYSPSNTTLYGPSRSGNAIDILAGLDYVASAVWRYRVLVGYEQRSYDNYRSHSSPVFEGDIIWQPDGLTTVTLKGLRTIEDANNLDIAGYIYTSGHLEVDHEYRRNVLLTGYVGIQHAEYLDSGGGNETYYGGGLGATWLVNRHVHLTASYNLIDHNGQNGYGPDYLEHVGLLTVKLGL